VSKSLSKLNFVGRKFHKFYPSYTYPANRQLKNKNKRTKHKINHEKLTKTNKHNHS